MNIIERKPIAPKLPEQKIRQAVRYYVFEGCSLREIARRFGMAVSTVFNWTRSQLWADEEARLVADLKQKFDELAIASGEEILGIIKHNAQSIKQGKKVDADGTQATGNLMMYITDMAYKLSILEAEQSNEDTSDETQ